MRRRPWWLIADTPGRARVQLVFPAVFLFTSVFSKRPHLWEWWEVLGLPVFLLLLSMSVTTLIAFRRHPDWVGREWAATRTSIWWKRHGRHVLKSVLVTAGPGAVVGLVLVVAGAGSAGIVLLVGGLLVATAAGMSLSAFDAFGPAGFRNVDARPGDRPSQPI